MVQADTSGEKTPASKKLPKWSVLLEKMEKMGKGGYPQRYDIGLEKGTGMTLTLQIGHLNHAAMFEGGPTRAPQVSKCSPLTEGKFRRIPVEILGSFG